jgi:hypothetical protein
MESKKLDFTLSFLKRHIQGYLFSLRKQLRF